MNDGIAAQLSGKISTLALNIHNMYIYRCICFLTEGYHYSSLLFIAWISTLIFHTDVYICFSQSDTIIHLYLLSLGFLL